MPEAQQRKSLGNRDLKKVLSSTRRYYGAYSDEYEDFYDNWLKGRGRFSDSEYRNGYDKVVEILTGLVSDGQMILDIGCGVGTWSVLMAKSGVNVLGLDYSSEILSKYKKRSEEEGVESKVFKALGDGFRLPFGASVFDGATLNWVLAHIPVRKNYEFLKEVHRVLKGDSWLMISDSYWRGQEGGKEQVQTRRTKRGSFEVYKYYYSPEALRDLLESTLGEVVYMETTTYEMLCVARKHKN